MALNSIHLHKLLKVLFLSPSEVVSELRRDVRQELAREDGGDKSGSDFYGAFWADAKAHVFDAADLHEMVRLRIAANERSRKNLYPRLRDGFLLWWNERRRWTNEPFRRGRSLKARFAFPGLDATVKIDGLLCVTDGVGTERAVYPYFGPDPALSELAARWGLWLLTTAFPNVPRDEFRILDVIRGRTFSLDRTPLTGIEESEFRRRYDAVLQQRQNLMMAYRERRR